MSRLDLYLHRVQLGWRKGQRSNIFTFYRHVRILNKDKISSNRNWYFLKRNMEKNQTVGRLVIRRPCPVVSEKNCLGLGSHGCHGVTVGSLRSLCSGSAKRTTFEFFHFLEALEDSIEYFLRKIGIV